MGSSGAFTVSLLKALAQARSTSITPGALAEAASEIEIEILKEPVGKQDTYVAAHGGICSYTFHADDSVDVVPLELSPDTLRKLRDNLLLFYTGEARAASSVLTDQDERSRRGDDEMLENLHRTKEMGYRSLELLLAGDLEAYAELMHEHWENKRRRSPGHGLRAHRHALHARTAQRRDRRQARRRGRRRASCSSTRAGPATRARRWPPQARRSSPSTSSSEAPSRAGWHERRPAAARRDRRLRAHRPQAG